MDTWVLFALFAMTLNVAKILFLKTTCKTIEPSILIFSARFFPAVILLLPAYFSDYKVLDAATFSAATCLAAILTMFASVLYIKSLQKGFVAIVSPIQASVPIFMILTTYLLYNEKPGYVALAFIIAIACSLSYVILATSRNKNGNAHKENFTPVIMSISAAALYGISTVIDRIAISATTNGAVLYSVCWSSVTTILLTSYFIKHHDAFFFEVKRNSYPILWYSIIATLAFVFQQLAVEKSITIDNGVTYVKSIVMIHIGIAAILGMILFKEKPSKGILASNSIALLSGIGLAIFG